MREEFERWFTEKYPDDAAVLKLYEGESELVTALDTLLPSRKHMWSWEAWKEATRLAELKAAELVRRTLR